MRTWTATRLAPIESPTTHALQGSIAVDETQISRDFADIQREVSPDYIAKHRIRLTVEADFVRPLLDVEIRSFPVWPDPIPHLLMIDSAITAPGISTSYDLEIPVPNTFSMPLSDRPEISENLLDPLMKSVLNGKDYSAGLGQEKQHGLGQTEQLLLFKHFDDWPRRGTGFQKAYRQSSGGGPKLRQTLDLWDLLLPLLKPPLHIDAPSMLDLPNNLYSFQVEGIRALIAAESFLLGDEMGTGKTVMTSVALRILFHAGRIQRALVVCPKSILGVWDAHLRDWADTLAVTVVNGSKDVRQLDWQCPAHVYVVTYDTLRNDSSQSKDAADSLMDLANKELNFDAVVLDEAHYLRNPKSRRSRAVRRISENAKFRWALTGTPIQNSIDDLRSIFQIVCPSLFPSQADSISAAQVRTTIEPHFLRRRKQDVFKDLPSKILSDEWLDLDSSQRLEYEKVLGEGKESFRSGKKTFQRIHIFALLTKLKSICNFATGFNESPKCTALLEQVDEIVANDKKVLVFTQFKAEGVNKLRPLLECYGVVSITGDSSDSARKRAVEQFQNDPETQVFLATPKTAGEGITLTAASYVIHFDHWWNPSVAWQAEDRAHRKGQTETVNVYRYWMRDTVEERIRDILDRKGLLHEEIINSMSDSVLDESLTIDDLAQVLDLDVDSVVISESERAKKTEKQNVAAIYELLSQMDPYEFEHIVKRVFKEVLGFFNARVTRKSADGGIDIEATKVGASGGIERIVVQCKRTPKVGVPVARELLGVVTADPSLTKGYLVTSGQLTTGCRDFCQDQGALEGIEGVKLSKWIFDQKIDLGESEGQ